MVNFSAIPVFVSVVESGSFSAAASLLGITKSAVSKRISQLEHQLGVRLLNRSTRSLTLTEAGKAYFDYARQAFQLAEEGKEAIQQLRQAPAGRLRVNVPMSFGRLHIAPLIKRFLEQYPDIDLQLTMDDRMVDFVEDRIDIGIRIGNLPDSTLIAQRLSPCRSVLCASPDYIQQHGEPLSPADLKNHNCLYYSYFRGGAEWTFFHNRSPVRVMPRGNYQVNNSEALQQALLDGLGIAQMPTFIVGPDLMQGKLVSLLTDYPLPEHAIYILYPDRQHLPLKVRAFRDFMIEHFKTDFPTWDE
ncbi:LysR substrate-binding domain-containing protein [Endozoicomonadaceae bacterium StTr2]